MQNDIVDVVKQNIEENHIKPEWLILELTERLAINDLARTKQTLLDIKALGVRLALDDFGTGYTAISSIRALPFDIIKIDKEFVSDIETSDFSQAFVRTMVQLGKTICSSGFCAFNAAQHRNRKIRVEIFFILHTKIEIFV